MNVISILMAVVSLILLIVGLIPLLGWLQWIVVAGTVVGVFFGALSKERSGLIINLVFLAVALFRLFIGGGIV